MHGTERRKRNARAPKRFIATGEHCLLR